MGANMPWGETREWKCVCSHSAEEAMQKRWTRDKIYVSMRGRKKEKKKKEKASSGLGPALNCSCCAAAGKGGIYSKSSVTMKVTRTDTKINRNLISAQRWCVISHGDLAWVQIKADQKSKLWPKEEKSMQLDKDATKQKLFSREKWIFHFAWGRPTCLDVTTEIWVTTQVTFHPVFRRSFSVI